MCIVTIIGFIWVDVRGTDETVPATTSENSFDDSFEDSFSGVYGCLLSVCRNYSGFVLVCKITLLQGIPLIHI